MKTEYFIECKTKGSNFFPLTLSGLSSRFSAENIVEGFLKEGKGMIVAIRIIKRVSSIEKIYKF
jgi:hypothetical protein